MIWLLLSIVTSTILFIVFKFISKHKVKTLQAIVINYTICVLMGFMIQGTSSYAENILQASWFLPAIILGFFFISIFYLTAMCVSYNGVTVASIASKLSLIIPTVAAYFLYNDNFTFQKIVGIILAMLAVVFASYTYAENRSNTIHIKTYLLPISVLLGGGFIDTMTKYSQMHYVSDNAYTIYLIFVFGTAATIGWGILLYRYLVYHEHIEIKSIRYGIILGVPNYGSMFFLLKALNELKWDSSTFFPINNISVVVLCSICGLIIFKEKWSKINIAGIILAVSAIILIM